WHPRSFVVASAACFPHMRQGQEALSLRRPWTVTWLAPETRGTFKALPPTSSGYYSMVRRASRELVHGPFRTDFCLRGHWVVCRSVSVARRHAAALRTVRHRGTTRGSRTVSQARGCSAGQPSPEGGPEKRRWGHRH